MSRSPPSVLPQIKEFERVSTTGRQRLCRAGPVARYLERLERRASPRPGMPGRPLIIQSHGGWPRSLKQGRLAAGGGALRPAGGVAGSVFAARLIAEDNLIPFDMGGHKHRHLADRCEGRPSLAAGTRRVAGQTIALNSLDITSIGAGGGSIARVDAGGILHVGPQSAGRFQVRPATAKAVVRRRSPTPNPGARLSRPSRFSRRAAQARSRGRRDGGATKSP